MFFLGALSFKMQMPVISSSQKWIVLVNLIMAICSTKKDVVGNREVLATLKPIKVLPIASLGLRTS